MRFLDAVDGGVAFLTLLLPHLEPHLLVLYGALEFVLTDLRGHQPLVSFLGARFSLVRADQVLPEAGGVLERALAQRASARTLARVDALMVLEVLQPAEAFPAHAAGVRLLARVRAPMLAQAVQVAETGTALAAHVRLLARVDAQVRLESTGFAESPSAHAARVRLLPRVDAQVLLQARQQPERLATLQAKVRSLTGHLAHQLRGRASTPTGVRGGVACTGALPRRRRGHGHSPGGAAQTRWPLRRRSNGGRRRAVLRAGGGGVFSGLSPGSWNALILHHMGVTLVTLALTAVFGVASATHRPRRGRLFLFHPVRRV